MLFHTINHETKDLFETSQRQSDILTDKHWEKRRETEVGNPPCRHSMQAYSSAIRTNQDLRNGRNGGTSWVLYVSARIKTSFEGLIQISQMPYLHWEYASIVSQIESLTEEVTKPVQHVADMEGLTQPSFSEITGISCNDDGKLLRLYSSTSQPMQVRRTLSSSHYCFAGKRKQQLVNKVAKYTEANALLSNKDKPVLMVDQLWMWLIGKSKLSG